MFAKPILVINSLLVITSVIDEAYCTLPPGGTTLPSTVIISVMNFTGSVIGTLNGYGNFSSPGPSYPFRAYPDTEGFARLSSYSLMPCFDNGDLSCTGNSPDSTASFYKIGPHLAVKGVEGVLFSIDAQTDEAGGVNSVGLKRGIPVHIGPCGAVIVTLSVKSAQG